MFCRIARSGVRCGISCRADASSAGIMGTIRLNVPRSERLRKRFCVIAAKLIGISYRQTGRCNDVRQCPAGRIFRRLCFYFEVRGLITAAVFETG